MSTPARSHRATSARTWATGPMIAMSAISSSGTAAAASSRRPSRNSAPISATSAAYPMRANTSAWKFIPGAPMPPR